MCCGCKKHNDCGCNCGCMHVYKLMDDGGACQDKNILCRLEEMQNHIVVENGCGCKYDKDVKDCHPERKCDCHEKHDECDFDGKGKNFEERYGHHDPDFKLDIGWCYPYVIC